MNRIPVPPRLTSERIAAALVAALLIGAFLGLLASFVTGSSYAANRQVLIRVWSIDSLVLSGQTADITVSDLSDAATIMTSSDVLDEARSTLDENPVSQADLAASVTAVPASTSDFVELTVTGPSAAEADRRAQAIASAFVVVVREKVLASARQIADQTAGSTDAVPADIAARAAAIANLDPVQVYTTTATVPTGTSRLTTLAVGAVAGLGLAALAVVLLAFGPARLRRTEDITETLARPGSTWLRDGEARRDAGVPADLLAAARVGVVAICPARPTDVESARDFASWLVAEVPGATVRGPGDTWACGVVVLDPPGTTLQPTPVESDAVAVAVLVTEVGVTYEAALQATTMVERWHPVDAVVLVG